MGRLAQHASLRFYGEESDSEEEKMERDKEVIMASSVDVGKRVSADEDSRDIDSNETDENDCDVDVLRADFIDHMEQRFLKGTFQKLKK